MVSEWLVVVSEWLVVLLDWLVAVSEWLVVVLEWPIVVSEFTGCDIVASVWLVLMSEWLISDWLIVGSEWLWLVVILEWLVVVPDWLVVIPNWLVMVSESVTFGGYIQSFYFPPTGLIRYQSWLVLVPDWHCGIKMTNCSIRKVDWLWDQSDSLVVIQIDWLWCLSDFWKVYRILNLHPILMHEREIRNLLFISWPRHTSMHDHQITKSWQRDINAWPQDTNCMVSKLKGMLSSIWTTRIIITTVQA